MRVLIVVRWKCKNVDVGPGTAATLRVLGAGNALTDNKGGGPSPPRL